MRLAKLMKRSSDWRSYVFSGDLSSLCQLRQIATSAWITLRTEDACAEETEALQASSVAAFCYDAFEGLNAAVLQHLQKAATDAAISQELV